MDVDTMDAGPELDALIAEQVMGKRWYISQYGRYFLVNPTEALLDVVQPCAAPPPEQFREAARLNNGHPYSTDMTEAWRVVDVLLQRGWGCQLQIAWGGEMGVEASFAHPTRPDAPDRWARAGTAPLAICRAALKVPTK